MTSPGTFGAVTVVGFVLSWIGGKWSHVPETADSTSKAIVDVLQEQLLRCGPSELARPCAACPAVTSPFGALLAGIVIGGLAVSVIGLWLSRGLHRDLAFSSVAARDVAVQLCLTGIPDAADIAPWAPPQGSRSRRV